MKAVKRPPVWPYLLLSVALLGALGFGWQQTRIKNQLALDAENKYMSAFHKLKWTSENIEDRSSRLMATNDPQLQESLLADLRVFSAQAVEHMSVLPFITLDVPQIQNFLNTLRQKSDEYHYKLSNGTPLSEEEWDQMVNLRKQAISFEEELSGLLGLVGNNMIRWGDTVEVTSPNQTGNAATPITESVLHLESELKAPPQQQGAHQQRGPLPPPQTDPGERVSPHQAAGAVRNFVDLPLREEPEYLGGVDIEDQEGGFSLYYFNAVKQNGLPLNFGVSVHGGHVIYALDGREVRERLMSEEELIQRAKEMLDQRGYPDMVNISHAENENILMMNFAPRVGGVVMDVDRIVIMLAMDNGEIVGFDARDYWINRKDRDLPEPKLTAGDARGRISKHLQATEEPALTMIHDRRSQERLVWSVKAAMDSQEYRVFVDALTGAEVDVQRMGGDPAPALEEGQYEQQSREGEMQPPVGGGDQQPQEGEQPANEPGRGGAAGQPGQGTPAQPTAP